MDKITSVKSHIKLSHWVQLIGECQNSGLTVKDWCGNNGVSKDSSAGGNVKNSRRDFSADVTVIRIHILRQKEKSYQGAHMGRRWSHPSIQETG